MRLFVKALIILFLSISSAQADQILRELTVKQVFAESATTAGFYPNEGLPECKWGLMYLDLSKESGKAIFAMVLAAKAAGQKVVRVDYSVLSTGTCLVSGLHTR